MSRKAQLALAALAVAVAAGVEVAAAAPLPGAIGDAVAGATLLTAGVLAAGTERGRGTGILLTVTGAAWLAGTLSGALVFVHRAPLLHLVLAYPRLWPASRGAGALIVAGYACALITPLARSAEATLVLAGVLALAAARRHGNTAGIERRARAAALGAALMIAAALTVAAAGRLAGGSLDDFALWAYDAAVAGAALGLGADLRWGRWEHAAISELVVDLGELQRPGALQDRLARTLGDPELRLGFATPDGTYHDESGRPFELTGSGQGRAVSSVEDDGRRVAVLVHDAALLADQRLLGAALSAARLAAANERMQGEVRAGVEQLESSRRRLVEAAIEQRRALEEELRTGAEQRLLAVAQRIRKVAAGEALAELLDSIARAREDLRRFAQGIHPAVLTDQGLRAALEDAARAMPFEVAVDAPDERLPPNVEVTVYFLCTEALANAGKHAGATRVQIEVRSDGGVVEAIIRDDGAGGAALEGGTGLRGLADRVAALGGSLDVHSPAGEGTQLHASVPI